MKRNRFSEPKATERQAHADHLQGEVLSLIPVLGGILAVMAGVLMPEAAFFPAIGAGVLLLGMVAVADEVKLVKAGVTRDSVGRPKGFTLSIGGESVTLYPGISWAQVDRYKWSARGLIDEPNMFHVFPNGSVEINSDRIGLGDTDGPARLQLEINKRHALTVAQIAPTFTSPHPAAAQTQTSGVGKVHFTVRLDRFDHVVIDYVIAGEHETTGLRGIPTLIANELLARPGSIHVDPMQRAVEIDGVRYECTKAGAHLLEEALNTRYAARSRDDKGVVIEVKESAVSTTGFDIRFMTFRAGMALEVKDHLSQENLDILTDRSKCDLIQPGIQIRLAPPYLLIRKRRPDMGEDKIPGLADVNYLQVTASQLQRVLNHPLIRKGGGEAGPDMSHATAECPANIVKLRVMRNPENKAQLWLQCVTAEGTTGEGKALTRHNIAELQHRGFFLAHLDVCLSLDNRKLGILDRQTNHEESITVDVASPDEVLAEAGRMLTNALKPAAQISAPVRSEIVNVEPMETPRFNTDLVMEKAARETAPKEVEQPVSVAGAKSGHDPTIGALFRETDPVRVNVEIFRRVSRHFEVEPQDMRFSLPMVFEDRRFEILSFYEGEIESLDQLRGEEFCGFYLTHVNEQKQVLVYSCNGTHIEWGPNKCVFLQSANSEAEEYPTSALLGLAQDKEEQLVFVVQRAFKEWIKPREKLCNELLIHFCVVSDLAFAPENYSLIWPVKEA